MANPFLEGNFAPVTAELDAPATVTAGSLPPGLRGTLYRNGSNPRWRPVEPYHWFTGDGMVHAVTLGDGQARYRNRWVRTPRFVAEGQAGRALFAGFGQPLTPEAGALDTGVANTHVIAHAGRLLALEEAHLPTRLAPDLATLGPEDFGGVLRGRFTAHPKRDPRTGELLFFSYSATGPLVPTMSWGSIGADGAVARDELFEAPYCSMVHDFAVTAARIVFPVLPLTGDHARRMAGGPAFAWDASKPAMLGVMDRAAGVASLRWVEMETCFAFHVLNAFDDGDSVVADVVEYPRAPLFPNADGSMPSEPVSSRLMRWRIGAGVERTVLDELPGEFPRIDERRAGLPYAAGFRVCTLPDGEAAVVRHDLPGSRRVWTLPPGDRPSEAVFAPSGLGEAEGWLLTVVWRPERGESVLVVLDAATMTAVAEVTLPQRVPHGFHGSWLGAGEAVRA